ncbi:hypothetical protein C2W62_40500 [Candidatus Entotheonella serta]|nr:hypothetical protein C2W62_40500 [Candidatus Entotheonella serta]
MLVLAAAGPAVARCHHRAACEASFCFAREPRPIFDAADRTPHGSFAADDLKGGIGPLRT